ncbi:hypothetical protein CDD83_7705 [Cordyceps sp. RAO-2017]|nr:hypothetical protein CDD83_7705 [Cordyceps sp. RAO-2017]
MRSVALVAALLGAVSATPFMSPGSSDYSGDLDPARTVVRARNANDKVRIKFVNKGSEPQNVYITGHLGDRWLFLKRDGSVATVGQIASVNDVAIQVPAHESGLEVQMTRPWIEGRIYAAKSEPGFQMHGAILGHPHTHPDAVRDQERTAWSYVTLQADDSELRFLSSELPLGALIGTPSMSVELRGDKQTASAEGLQPGCVENLCTDGSISEGSRINVCVKSGGKNVRLAPAERFVSANRDAFERHCRRSGDQRTANLAKTVVITDGNEMIVTLE